MRVRSVLRLSLVCLMVAAGAWAGTTGSLVGTVVDDQTQPLPGVTITITSPSLIGGPNIEATTLDGTFSFPALTPGIYTVKAEISGFVTQERTEVQVRLDRTTELNVQMPPSRFGEEITVVAETPVVDSQQVSTAQTFTAEYLKNAAVGSYNRGYQMVLTQAAGVAGGDNPNVYGSTERENAYYIDGIDTTDPLVGAWGTDFNFDSIQEISFQTGGFEAEYGRATGGVVNLITKSGGNTFSGTFDVRYRTEKFYQSSDHYDPDASPQKYLDPGFTLGGPILKDKVWFFTSYQNIDSRVTPSEAPTTYTWKGQNYLGKATWQIDPNWRLVAKVSGQPTTIDNADSSRFVAPEADSYQEQGGNIYQAELSGILSPKLLWNLGVGFNRGYLNNTPMSGDATTIGHFNDDTGMFTANSSNMEYSDRDRDEFKTNLSYFVDNLAGAHELKGGLEVSDMSSWGDHYTTGGYQYEDLTVDPQGGDFTPVPFVMWEIPRPAPKSYQGTLRTAFVQDAWRITPALTLKLGVRYDNVRYDGETGEQLVDMTEIQPRLGVAWDVTGDAKNVAKVSWGRFMAPDAMQVTSFVRPNDLTSNIWLSCSTYFGDIDLCQAYVAARAARGFRWTAGPDDWDPNGWWFNPANTYGGASTNVIDPDLKPTYANELIVGFERELFTRTSVELTYVDKKTRDLYEDTCIGNLTEPSADANCDYYIMANLPNLKRDYNGLILRFETRPRDWFHILASYTYSKSKGSSEATWHASEDFDIYPYHWVNMYGYLADDRRHRVKVNGFVMLPYDVTVGVDAFWSSPFDWTPTATAATIPDIPYGDEFTEPRGSRRANSNYQLDVQASKGFKVGAANLELILVVYNLLNSERVTDVCDRVEGCGAGIAMGDPTSWQFPRRFEAGFRVEF